MDYPLKCAQCLQNEGQDVTKFLMGDVDYIGRDWLPAIPNDYSFWGFASAPPEQVNWWRRLPNNVRIQL
jgi:hypothetical protein